MWNGSFYYHSKLLLNFKFAFLILWMGAQWIHFETIWISRYVVCAFMDVIFKFASNYCLLELKDFKSMCIRCSCFLLYLSFIFTKHSKLWNERSCCSLVGREFYETLQLHLICIKRNFFQFFFQISFLPNISLSIFLPPIKTKHQSFYCHWNFNTSSCSHVLYLWDIRSWSFTCLSFLFHLSDSNSSHRTFQNWFPFSNFTFNCLHTCFSSFPTFHGSDHRVWGPAFSHRLVECWRTEELLEKVE